MNTSHKPKVGSVYHWKYTKDQDYQLVYLGKSGAWHQFKKIGDPRPVWCEVLDSELHMIEEVK